MESGRRSFLRILAAAASALGASREGLGAESSPKAPGKGAGTGTGANLFTRGGKSLVAAVGGKNLPEMIGKVVSLIGGFGPLGLGGKSVLVKPNVVGANRNPTTTNPELVGAVVRALFGAGAGKVYVGDMSALVRGSTKKNMERIGILAAAREAGAEPVFFEDHKWVKVKVGGNYLKEVSVTEWIYKVDRVVNLPVIKTHEYAGYSICLKNFVGATHLSQRPYLVNPLRWEEIVAELNLAYRPELNLADGTMVMVEGGPWEGRAEEANLLLASGDRVACDVVGLAVIKSYGRWKRILSVSPWEMGQVKRAVELGLGARSGREMELAVASLDGDPAFSSLMEKAKSFL
ncbi:MAG: DUF362 domain-containing protein [Deltaproteobacteria bacterium]|nr:DUF362 domain-containing protein [Candidatus Deferrimicrobiaceae bacterium]